MFSATSSQLLRSGQVRPPVEHKFGCGPLPPSEERAHVKVFQHRLLQHFMLSVFCKLPVQPVTTNADLRRQFMVSHLHTASSDQICPPLARLWIGKGLFIR